MNGFISLIPLYLFGVPLLYPSSELIPAFFAFAQVHILSRGMAPPLPTKRALRGPLSVIRGPNT